MQHCINVDTISYAYHDKPNLFDHFSLSIETGKITALMGASGIGKSSLGQLIAGIYSPHEGEITFNKDIKKSQDVIYIDQKPINSIFPWQNVRNNLAYPLRKLRWNSQTTKERVGMLLNQFGLKELTESYPAQLSGGELQRLALARCLAWKPRLVILDEALSALDAKTKTAVMCNLKRLAKDESMTLLLITHSLTDVVSLSQRCVVINNNPVTIIADEHFADQDGALNQYRPCHDKLMEVLKHGII